MYNAKAKKSIISILVISLLLVNSITTFATAPSISDPTTPVIKKTDIDIDYEDQIQVYLNNELLNFSYNPFIIKNRVMVPMREFFNALDAQVHWYDRERYVIGYKNNSFIKLQIDNKTGYKNGAPFTLPVAPIIHNEKTFVPVNFIAETFELDVRLSDDNKRIDLSTPNQSIIYRKYEDLHYKEVPIDEYGIHFLIPFHWTKYDRPYTYGNDDTTETHYVTVGITELEEDTTLDQFSEAYKKDLYNNSGENITFTNEYKVKLNNFDGNVLYIKNTQNVTVLKQILYFFKIDNIGYKFVFSYINPFDEKELIDTFAKIANSFYIDNLTIDSKTEHYIEFNEYFNLGMKLDSTIYSNKEYKNFLLFQGSIDTSEKIEHLLAKVEKDNKSIIFQIPLKDNKFSSKIYTPFGLGKHNIIITRPDTNESLSFSDFTMKQWEKQEEIEETPVDLENETETANENTEAPDETSKEITDDKTETMDPIIESNTENTDDSSGFISPISGDLVTDTDTDTNNLEDYPSPDKDTEGIDTKETDPEDTNESINDSIFDQSTPDKLVESNTGLDSTKMGQNSSTIMKFSVLNSSAEKIKNVIPSLIIQSDHVNLRGQASLVTRKDYFPYSKAKSLYNYILENVAYLDSNEKNRTAYDVYLDLKGTDYEIEFYHVALLRSLSIPTKLLRGETDKKTNYWLEAYINGQWILMDSSNALRNKHIQSFGLEGFVELDSARTLSSYFNIPRSEYYNYYKNIEVMNY